MARRLAAMLAGLTTAAVLAGCGTAPVQPPAPPTTPAAAPAPPAAPKDRACYRMTLRQSIAPTSAVRPTPCSTGHTTETYLVGQLDTSVGGHLLAVDSDHVAAQVADTCRGRLSRFLGGTPDQARLSMVRAVWFTPTVAQSDRGANWFRCDVVAVADRDSLARLDGSLRQALAHPRRRVGLAMCGTAAPSDPRFHRVLCSSAHTWKAIAVVPLPGKRYPGVAAAKRAGQSRCQDAASAAASDPLSFKWSYEWPTAKDWSLDQHYGICWTTG